MRARPFLVVIGLSVVLLLIFSGYQQGSVAQSRPFGVPTRPTQYSVTTELLSPSPAGDRSAPQLLSASQAEELRLKHYDRREALDARVDNNPGGKQVVPHAQGVEPPESGEFHGAPSTLLVLKNIENTLADDVTTLPEPVAANDGIHVFYMGNTHQEFSTNGGVTYTAVAIPAGPADAPTVCCDPDVIYDAGRAVTFRVFLYLNAAGTNGVVRIFVRQNMSLADNCSYTIDPAGAADNIVPDYPHLGLSNDFVYLAMNLLTSGTTWAGAQVRRFGLDQMADCVATPTSTFTYGPGGTDTGQRVFVPVDGARETMYWGAHVDADTFRIWHWAETAGAPISVDVAVGASAFLNPDCSGGLNGTDWIQRTTSWSITGFRMRGAVGRGRVTFLRPVSADAAHVQAHIHGHSFWELGLPSALTLAASPVITSATECTSYPAVGANDRGDLGVSFARGGDAGVAAPEPAVKGYIAVEDDFTAGTVFTTPILVQTGDFNPPIVGGFSRWGDYVSSRRHAPCGMWWTATSYGFVGGSTAANLQVKYIEYGRQRDKPCYQGWTDETRVP